jgi:hypothetical protein
MKYYAVEPPKQARYPAEIYNSIRKEYFFAKDDNLNVAYVEPFCIITDGHDIFSFADLPAKKFHMGFSYRLPKTRLAYRKAKRIDRAISTSILPAFANQFSMINYGGSPIDFDKIKVINTCKALFSPDRDAVYIFHFLLLPNEDVITCVPRSESNIALVNIKDAFGACFNDAPFRYLGGLYKFGTLERILVSLMSSGDMSFPYQKTGWW